MLCHQPATSCQFHSALPLPSRGAATCHLPTATCLLLHLPFTSILLNVSFTCLIVCKCNLYGRSLARELHVKSMDLHVSLVEVFYRKYLQDFIVAYNTRSCPSPIPKSNKVLHFSLFVQSRIWQKHLED